MASPASFRAEVCRPRTWASSQRRRAGSSPSAARSASSRRARSASSDGGSAAPAGRPLSAARAARSRRRRSRRCGGRGPARAVCSPRRSRGQPCGDATRQGATAPAPPGRWRGRAHPGSPERAVGPDHPGEEDGRNELGRPVPRLGVGGVEPGEQRVPQRSGQHPAHSCDRPNRHLASWAATAAAAREPGAASTPDGPGDDGLDEDELGHRGGRTDPGFGHQAARRCRRRSGAAPAVRPRRPRRRPGTRRRPAGAGRRRQRSGQPTTSDRGGVGKARGQVPVGPVRVELRQTRPGRPRTGRRPRESGPTPTTSGPMSGGVRSGAGTPGTSPAGSSRAMSARAPAASRATSDGIGPGGPGDVTEVLDGVHRFSSLSPPA